MHIPGAAGIEDGVTIDLGKMNKIEYSEKDDSVSVGAGAVWGELYEALDKIGVMVAGARSSSVGKPNPACFFRSSSADIFDR